MPQMPYGGYDAKPQYKRVEIRPKEHINIGKGLPLRKDVVHIPEPLPELSSTHAQQYDFQVNTLYAHQHGTTIWHSERVEVDDEAGVITDYGWETTYLSYVWTHNPVEENPDE